MFFDTLVTVYFKALAEAIEQAKDTALIAVQDIENRISLSPPNSSGANLQD